MDFMLEALNEAKKGVRKREGGPFGAVIVCGGKIIAKAHNTVLKDKNPVAHAEINAIMKASKKLKKFNLSMCELYSTCKPCPMCLSAIYWARIKKVFFSDDSKEAARIGFDDKKLYKMFENKNFSIKLIKKNVKESKLIMDEFVRLKGKMY
jgi:guanine deaminase